MKILLLAHTFPPYNASGAVRPAKLAEYLAGRGHDVRVLTGQPLPFPTTLTTAFPMERVIATRWRRIEAPLDMLRARLGARTKRWDTAPSAAAGSVRPTGAMRAVIAYRSMMSLPDAQVGWIVPAIAAGRRLLAAWRPDLIYSSALPFSSHVVAAALARFSRSPWVGEYRDLFSGNPYTDIWPARARLDKAIERRVMRSASATVSISEPLTAYLAALHKKPSATIMNGFDPGDFARAPDCTGEFDPKKVTIVYTGIIYPGRRDPAVLFEALRRMGDRRHAFDVRFYGASVESVMASAARAGVADTVRTFAPVSYLTSLGLQKAADILLLLLWDSQLERGVLTGKLFEYIGAQRPILSLGCVDGAAAGLIGANGFGLATSGPDRVAGYLLELAARKSSTGSTHLASQANTANFTRHAQFQKLESFLQNLGRLPDVA